MKDCLMYEHKDFNGCNKLKERRYKLLNSLSVLLVKGTIRANSKRLKRLIEKLLDTIIKSAYPSSEIVNIRLSEKPHICVICPLVGKSIIQKDLITACRLLGIKSIGAVHSWDNLTTKGVISEKTDELYVWNEFQREEAQKYHNMDKDRIQITGAYCYERWYDLLEKTNTIDHKRETKNGYILYLGSSKFIAPNEDKFFVKWFNEFKEYKEFSHYRVVIRPHPQNYVIWEGIEDISERIEVRPRGGENPIDRKRSNDYMETLDKASAIIGINTSAIVETAFVQHKVFSFEDQDRTDGDHKTIHINRLIDSGQLVRSKSIKENLEDIRIYIQDEDMKNKKSFEFLEYFVRKKGIKDSRATFVDMLCSNIEVEKGYLNKRISQSINWLDNGYGKESRKRILVKQNFRG